MTARPRVLLLIPHLGGGGAERVAALLSCGLSSEKYEVHLGVMTRSAWPCPFLPVSITVHRLETRRVRAAAVPLLRLVWHLRPQMIVSGMAHLNFLVLLLRPLFPDETRVVVRQNSTVSADLRSGGLPFYTRLLYHWLYPSADGIVCQTPAMATDLAEQSGISDGLIQVLPNPIDFAAMRTSNAAWRWPGQGPHVLAIGRLAAEKGFDLLLESFSLVRVKFPSADLTIVGEGPARALLMETCRELQLQSVVTFPGYIPRPEIYFPGATLFVLSSRWEGMPNALLEAAAAGLPIAALPSSRGVVDLLRGKSGVWMANETSCQALTDALLTALESLRTNERFAHSWVEPFAMHRAIRGYENLIDQTLFGHPR